MAAPDVGTNQVAEILGIGEEQVLRLALEVDLADPGAVRGALRARRLPGWKVSRVWLFRRADVDRFARIDRPVGRPRKTSAA